MRLLHTSAWHLGHLFCGRRRDGEFRDFLAWLLELIARESVDVLLIAGDLFDTNTPGNACAGMYYDFLTRVRRESGCRRVVITGGNHDSPSFLNAPRGLLDAAFDIKVFGEAAEDPADEVVPVPDDAGVPALIIGADVGSPVAAAAKGIVDSVKVDEETGTTVSMNIGNGYELTYGQLKEVSVKEGDVVEDGGLIGYVSEPSKYYCEEGSNLYFKLTKDGTPVDPFLFLGE